MNKALYNQFIVLLTSRLLQTNNNVLVLHLMKPNISEHLCYKEISKIMWDEVQK